MVALDAELELFCDECMPAAEEKNDSGVWRWLWWLLFGVLFYFVCPALWAWPIIQIFGLDGPYPAWLEAFILPANWLYDQWPLYESWVDWSMEKVGPR